MVCIDIGINAFDKLNRQRCGLLVFNNIHDCMHTTASEGRRIVHACDGERDCLGGASARAVGDGVGEGVSGLCASWQAVEATSRVVNKLFCSRVIRDVAYGSCCIKRDGVSVGCICIDEIRGDANTGVFQHIGGQRLDHRRIVRTGDGNDEGAEL